MTPWTVGERVSVHDGTTRVVGAIAAVIAARLLRIELPDGRRVWRRG